MPLLLRTREERKNFIGYFYENLKRHLTHSKLVSFEEWMSGLKNSGSFDFYDDRLGSFVEVKGSSNSDQLLLFADQLDRQVGQLGFPYDDGFTWIFSYRNSKKQNGKKHRLLKNNAKNSDFLFEFLSNNTLHSFVVYTQLLNLIRINQGIRIHQQDKETFREVVNINKTKLIKIASDLRSSFEELKCLDELPRWIPSWANKIPTRRINTSLNGQEINFDLIILLPNKLKIKLLKQMNGSVSIK